MDIIEFTFKDFWFDYDLFPLHVLRPYNKHDGSVQRYRKAWIWYMHQLHYNAWLSRHLLDVTVHMGNRTTWATVNVLTGD